MIELDIYINGKQPIPAIYNVKQFSAGADEFIFYIAKSGMIEKDLRGAAARIKTSNYTSAVELSEAGDFFVLKWLPDAKATERAGSFELQIEISKGDFIWQSYKAAFIVSESLAPEPPEPPTPPEPTPTAGGDVIKGMLWFDGGVDNGISGRAEADGNEKQQLPGDMPYKSGLTHYFDFTKYISNVPLRNAAGGAGLNGMLAKTEQDDAIIINGTDNSYLMTDIKDMKTLYVIYKAGSQISDWTRAILGTGYANIGRSLLVISSINGCVAATGNGSDVISQVNDRQYNVVCLTFAEGVYSLYINGEFINSGTGNIGARLGLGRMIIGTAAFSMGSYRNNDIYFKMLGIYDVLHGPDEVGAMSDYLLRRYGNEL